MGAAPIITALAPVPSRHLVPNRPSAPAPAPALAPGPPGGRRRWTGGSKLEAPMPGMVIRYEVKEGESVKEGDVVMILEAMKMENSILAQISGTVKQILCKEGQSVQKGDVLAVIG